MSRVTHLKIKIKNLAAESGIIRLEENKLAKADAYRKAHGKEKVHFTRRVELADHRRGIVRSVARVNLLAYGFLRGRSYARMEVKTISIPDFKDILKHAKNFSPAWGDEEKLEWEVWLGDAKAHLSAQHPASADYLTRLKIAA